MLFLVPLLRGSKSPSKNQHVIEHTHGLRSFRCGYIAAAIEPGLCAVVVVPPLPLPALPVVVPPLPALGWLG
jgi:hypothetical protein